MLNFMHRIAGGRLLAAIGVIAMTLGGLFAFRSLPVDAFPDRTLRIPGVHRNRRPLARGG